MKNYYLQTIRVYAFKWFAFFFDKELTEKDIETEYDFQESNYLSFQKDNRLYIFRHNLFGDFILTHNTKTGEEHIFIYSPNNYLKVYI